MDLSWEICIGRKFIGLRIKYNKSYPEIKIIQANTKYIKTVEGYRFLDWATPSYISYILFLNLKDVGK